MNVYEQTFLPIFLVGCAIAACVSFVAARKPGFAIPGKFFGIGVLTFWAALFVASDTGYRAWQSIPNPPPEAFSDSGPAGALILGWVPGCIFCGLIFGLVRLIGGKPPAKRITPRRSRTLYRPTTSPNRKDEHSA